jgi:hypothetical protein
VADLAAGRSRGGLQVLEGGAHDLGESRGGAPEIARLRGIALAGIFQIIIAEAGRRTREGQSQDQIADELRPAIEAVLDDLDRWLTPAADQDGRRSPDRGGRPQ